MEYKGQREELPVLIVGGSGPSLFGWNWLHRLKLDWNEICHVGSASTLTDILGKHAAVLKKMN